MIKFLKAKFVSGFKEFIFELTKQQISFEKKYKTH